MVTRSSALFKIDEIRSALRDHGLGWIHKIEYFDSIASTNDYLMRKDSSLHGQICIADCQTQGKGRHGKRWVSTPGHNLMFSLGWAPLEQSGPELSLVVGLAIADALQAEGIRGIGLKWPNDVLLNGVKLSGILLESRVIAGRLEFVIGVGLNISLQADDMQAVATHWTDIAASGLQGISRELWLVKLLIQLDRRLKQLQEKGFVDMHDDWTAYHIYQGVEMRYQRAGVSCVGRIVGLNSEGALLLESDGDVSVVHSGEVNTLRKC